MWVCVTYAYVHIHSIDIQINISIGGIYVFDNCKYTNRGQDEKIINSDGTVINNKLYYIAANQEMLTSCLDFSYFDLNIIYLPVET